jgi:glycosyltransferase 2 family protein
LLGLVWILYRFVRTGVIDTLRHSVAFDRIVIFTALAIPIYAAGLCFVGVAWWCVQSAFLPTRPPFRKLFGVYATTQFAKYLPGNVGHLVGRHILLRRLGMQHHALLLATLVDAACLVLAALVPASTVLQTLLPALPIRLNDWQTAIAEAVIVIAAYALVQILRRRNAPVAQWVPLHVPRWLLLVFPLQWLFFACMTLALLFPAHMLLPNAQDLWLLPAIAAASWVAGFLVIGAPAGLGVREVVFVTLLKGHLSEQDILLLAAIFRIITFGGDVLFLLLGLALGGGRSSSATEAAPDASR